MGSDYFTFADKLEATLRGIGRRQVREAEEQAAMINSLLIDPGWHHCLLDKKDESETNSWSDTDEESGPGRVETTTSRRALARLRAAKPCLYACVYWLSLPLLVAGR